MTFALAAAGTGGHIYPALAVAEELEERGVRRDEIVFFGGSRLEKVAVPGAGFELVEIEIRGLSRSLSMDNITLPAVVTRAARAVGRELEARRVRVLGAFGGYVSVPAAWGARRAGARYVLHEQNAVPGLANKLIARRAERVMVAFPAAARTLTSAEVVGNPLRSALASFDRAELRPSALSRYGLDGDRPVLGILGGSQGARVLNETAALIRETAPEAQIIHLTGTSHEEAMTARATDDPEWHVVAFEPEMQFFYGAADLVLSRAGALTISELAATGTPAVVVPYAAGTGAHQAANAAQLVEAGGALLVEEGEGAALAPAVAELLADDTRRMIMAKSAASVAQPDAAARVADAMVEVAA
jgi:UDP-N-acetylglucosamine--N-acetylmuramyl-(pentapeptide) pyrophosphoryl-undecaprenol N-acetylglucosamine transferase